MTHSASYLSILDPPTDACVYVLCGGGGHWHIEISNSGLYTDVNVIHVLHFMTILKLKTWYYSLLRLFGARDRRGTSDELQSFINKSVVI